MTQQDPESKVTIILNSVFENRNEATEKLLPVVYEQLRQLAANRLSAEPSGHTLQPTALVHEAYLKLLANIEDSWQNRSHFFGAAAEAMRRILIDHARTKNRQKRGGRAEQLTIDNFEPSSSSRDEELIELDQALSKLESIDQQKAQLVKLKFFAGLNMQQAAEAMEMSLRTAERHWTFAKLWLQDEMIRGC